jgi:hypothetical protein
MKIMNWGKGITIFMVAFMAFIGSMVYYAFTKNADLVEEDYYENELNYDKNKESKSNYDVMEEESNAHSTRRGCSVGISGACSFS